MEHGGGGGGGTAFGLGWANGGNGGSGGQGAGYNQTSTNGSSGQSGDGYAGDGGNGGKWWSIRYCWSRRSRWTTGRRSNNQPTSGQSQGGAPGVPLVKLFIVVIVLHGQTALLLELIMEVTPQIYFYNLKSYI